MTQQPKNRACDWYRSHFLTSPLYKRFNISSEAELQRTLLELHSLGKARLLTLRSKGLEETSPKIQAEAGGLFETSLGLLAFGNLDQVAEIIEYDRLWRAKPGRSLKRYIHILQNLLPLPEHLVKPNLDLPNIKKWVEENKENLTWDEELGQFILAVNDSGRIARQ